MSFTGSTKPLALITGAANGIGLATARNLAAKNYDLVLFDRDQPNLELAQAELEKLGAEVQIHNLDLSKSHALEGQLETIINQLEIDALVNNAGVGFARTVEQTTLDEWELTFAVNITASFLLCKIIVPQMIKRGGGVIVNVASAASLIGLKNRVAYGASKSAVLGLTRCIAADHAAEGIRINAIAPGTVDSTWIARILSDDPDPVARRKMMEARQLDGKMGTPEEVAHGISFLLSPEARFVNGTVFSMDAGLTAV
jgi:NAD(P)-dependent dehydrogenase (short-subunit alcohol dehydrogenase family)